MFTHFKNVCKVLGIAMFAKTLKMSHLPFCFFRMSGVSKSEIVAKLMGFNVVKTHKINDV